MNESSKYWKLVRIDAADEGRGYKLQSIPVAQEFFGENFPESTNHLVVREDRVYRQLFNLLRETTAEEADRVEAELCLRCYVSYPILQSCMKRVRLFGSANGFTYRDLLPFVLNDDGKRSDGGFVPFSLKILHSFSPDQTCSLGGWVDLRVKRNPDLNRFLLEQGLNFTSDWALLNRANPRHLAGVDRALVEVFHLVYRRDRRRDRFTNRRHRQGTQQKCLDPTNEQLQEMMQWLRQRQGRVDSTSSLLNQLKQLAQVLRQEDIWGRRGFPVTEPLETTDPNTGETSFKDVPDNDSASDIEASERSELQQFCYEQLLHSLDQGIRQAIGDRVHSLKQRPRYTQLAHQVKPALRLLYFEGKSQEQIASMLGMTNQSQVSRILNPKELLISIRQRTLEALLHGILEKVRELKIVDFPVSPDYFSNLMEQLDAFVDEQVFQAAAAEMNAGRDRSMKSLFAQRLRQILNEQPLSPTA